MIKYQGAQWTWFFSFCICLISGLILICSKVTIPCLSVSGYHSYMIIQAYVFLPFLNFMHLSWSNPSFSSIQWPIEFYTKVPFQANFLLCPSTTILFSKPIQFINHCFLRKLPFYPIFNIDYCHNFLIQIHI